MLRLSNASALWRQIASKNSLQVAGLQLPKFSTEAAKAKEDDDSFELLPPGCSMVDPTYALKDSETTVLFYDEKQQPEVAPLAGGAKRANKRIPKTPANLAAAQKKLEDAKHAAEDEPYVYLPPGCSIRDPGYNSMSDPMERRVYHRDPPAAKND